MINALIRFAVAQRLLVLLAVAMIIFLSQVSLP